MLKYQTSLTILLVLNQILYPFSPYFEPFCLKFPWIEKKNSQIWKANDPGQKHHCKFFVVVEKDVIIYLFFILNSKANYRHKTDIIMLSIIM